MDHSSNTLKKKIALVGNPNSGKSTLFNILTGLNQKTGNFPGVTVERKTGSFSIDNCNIEITDLPGTYSIYPKSLDERITSDVITSVGSNQPDLIIYVADACNLKRSLFLCTQLIDLKLPVIVVLNMMDLAQKNNLIIDFEKLSDSLGVNVIPVSAQLKTGLDKLGKTILHHFNSPETNNKSFFELPSLDSYTDNNQTKSLSLSYAELHYQLVTNSIPENFNSRKFQLDEIAYRFKKLKSLTDIVSSKQEKISQKVSYRIDDFVTHKIGGLILFFFILLLVFQSVFTLSAYPMQWIENGFTFLTQFLSINLPDNFFTNLLINGIIAGLGGVVIFIPQIALLFLFISILEDSGYMARVSVMMDKFMRQFGLNGRSVIPLMSSAACAVPAIMGARTISNWKERLITIMVTPLISCSARIPVFTLLIALVIPNKTIGGVLNLQGLVMFSLYLLGILASIIVAYIISLLIKSKEKSYFIMEMPLYRMPVPSVVISTIINKVKIFVVETGKVIIAISIVLWLLASFGPGNRFNEIDKKYESSIHNSTYSIQEIENMRNAEKLSSSYAGILGKTIEPVIKPLGFDWKIGVALITSFAAREVFVGTMSTIYSVGDEENISSLTEKMKNAKWDGSTNKIYTLASGVSLLLFYVFAMQCMSTLAVVKRETRSWKWPVFQFIYMTGLAYVLSLIVYQVFS